MTVVCSLAAGQLLLARPTATADTRSVALADALGITAAQAPVTQEAEQLGDLVASRSTRDADEATAATAQSQAEQAAAAAKAEADARAAAEAAAAAAAPAPAAGAPAATAAGSSATAVATITNSTGPVEPQTQAAANKVVSNVPGDHVHVNCR